MTTQPNLALWQKAFTRAVGAGEVVKVFAKDGSTGVALLIEARVPVEDGDAVTTETRFYSPLLETDERPDDLDGWVVMLEGATNWEEWDWGPPYDSIPAF